MRKATKYNKQEVKIRSSEDMKHILHACVFRLICALCECIVLVQVLQLPVPAPLMADFPVGRQTLDHVVEGGE